MSYKEKYLKYKMKYLAAKKGGSKENSIDIEGVSIRPTRHSTELTTGYKWQANKTLHLEKAIRGTPGYNHNNDVKLDKHGHVYPRLKGSAGDIKFNQVIFWRDNACVQQKRVASKYRVNTASKNRIDLLNHRKVILVSLRFTDVNQYNKLIKFLNDNLGQPCVETCVLNFDNERRRYAKPLGDSWCSYEQHRLNLE